MILCCQEQRSHPPAGIYTLEKPGGIWTTHIACSGKLNQNYHEDFLTPHRQTQPELSLPCSRFQQDWSQGWSGRGIEVSLAALLCLSKTVGKEGRRESCACCIGSAIFLPTKLSPKEKWNNPFSAGRWWLWEYQQTLAGVEKTQGKVQAGYYCSSPEGWKRHCHFTKEDQMN